MPTAAAVVDLGSGRYPLDAFLADISGVATSTDAIDLRRRSRDFFWYSPILYEQLKDKVADVIVTPRDEAEVVRVAAACAKHRIPLTVRGGATGNYGQCVPLAGGVVLDMAQLNRIEWQKPGLVRVEAGAKLFDIDTATRPNGFELRMHPSTKRSAQIGGFVAGGSGGVGSVNFGGMREPGNIVAARIVTLEPTPRVIELRGDQEVGPQQAAIGVEGLRHRVRRRQDQRVRAAEVDVELPDPGGPGDHGDRDQRPPHGATPSASSTRSRSAPTSGLVRRRGRSSVTSNWRTTRPGRGDSPTTRSARTTASSTSWVTRTTVRGSVASTWASHPCISARVIASSAANGSSRASTGLPASSERKTRPAGASRRQLRRPGLLEPRQSEARQPRRRRRPRLLAVVPAGA